MNKPMKIEDELPKDGRQYEGFGISAMGNVVIVKLLGKGEETAWVAIEPETAKQAGELMARCGHAVETQEDVYGQKPIIVEQIRKRLVLAVTQLIKANIINNKIEKPNYTAQRIVELMIAEFNM